MKNQRYIKKVILSIGLMITSGLSVFAQAEDPIQIGDHLPAFLLNNVHHFKRNAASNEDFMGKWLVMDFWFTGCVSCIKSFPKINQLQEKFRDKIQFVMVGKNDQKFNKGIELLYEKLRNKLQLNLISAYDSIIFSKWKINAMPYIIIVNPKGIVKGISEGSDLTYENLNKLLLGEEVSFYNSKELYRQYESFDNNGKPEYENSSYFSLLTPWKKGDSPLTYSSINFRPTQERPFNVEINQFSLNKFYLFAYTGGYNLFVNSSSDEKERTLYDTFYPLVKLKMRDTSLFENDYRIGKNMFNYKLRLTKKELDSAAIFNLIQEDLERAFGFHASVEYEKMPVWILKANDEAGKKLKTKGKKFYVSFDGGAAGPTGFSAVNIPAGRLLNLIFKYLPTINLPYFDETGLSGNIDISLDSMMTNLSDVMNELKKYGLEIQLGSRKMRVLTLRN